MSSFGNHRAEVARALQFLHVDPLQFLHLYPSNSYTSTSSNSYISGNIGACQDGCRA